MTHVEERLQQRFGITEINAPKLKYLTLNFGKKLFDSRDGAEFYQLELDGKFVYPVVSNGVVVTVYWASYVTKFARAQFGYSPKKLKKIMQKMRN